MKYKAGDKVKIKTWKEIEINHHSTRSYIEISHGIMYTKEHESQLSRCRERIVTIRRVYNGLILIEEGHPVYLIWTEWMIECLASDYKKPVPIYSRFEILDL